MQSELCASTPEKRSCIPFTFIIYRHLSDVKTDPWQAPGLSGYPVYIVPHGSRKASNITSKDCL